MSGFVFFAGPGPDGRARSLPPGALRGDLAPRGGDLWDEWNGDDAGFLLVRHGWEQDPDIAGRAMVTEAHGLVGVADASLYYRRDLVRSLRAQGIRPRGVDPSHLILAAYHAWGADCVDHLEGDFAFAIWDPRERFLFAARDPSGARELYSMAFEDGFVLGSSPPPLFRLLGRDVRLSTEGLLRALTFRSGDGTGTAWLDIDEIPPGHTLRFGPGGTAVVSGYHRPRRDPSAARLSEREAVRETRRLLADACAERAPASGVAVAMSGGYDSPAIYGTLQDRRSTDPGAPRPRAVTAAFPEGDPGNEDEYVSSILGSWGDTATWVDTGAVPVVEPDRGGASRRALPWAHHFEHMNRALARAAREGGSRVLLHGMAGDELFSVSPEYLADLLCEGRWLEFRREWRAFELEGIRDFRRFCVRPLVPDWVRGLRAALNGGPRWEHPLGAPLPPWLSVDALHRSGILERDRETLERFRALVRHSAGRSVADRERAASLIRLGSARVTAMLHGAVVADGVELRGPFLDSRLVEFVHSRPRRELVRGGETKILLRRAMEGLLPGKVLAPRERITGNPEAYFLRGLRASVPSLMRATDGARALGDLGLIDPARFRSSVDGLIQGDPRLALSIFHTLQTEMWLRSWQGNDRSEERIPPAAQPAFARSA